jgi:signal transduction histidine kinase
MSEAPVQKQAETQQPRIWFGLSTKLLLLTIGFVMLAEVLIFVPSVANFRNNWLNDRQAEAGIVAATLEGTSQSIGMETMLLDKLGAYELAVLRDGQTTVLATSQPIDTDYKIVDLMNFGILSSIGDAFGTLFRTEERILKIKTEPDPSGQRLQLLVPERALRTDMLIFARNITFLSLAISLITAALVYLALTRLFVRPLRRLDEAMASFASAPEDATKVLRPSGRHDEIGRAEERLSFMQKELVTMLGERRRLADLGLAVSKINHDLRNLLASVQILSDRLTMLEDPTVKRLAPKIVRAVDRAISFCEATLTYGQIKETPPRSQPVPLYNLAVDICEFAGLANHPAIRFENNVSRRLQVMADPDYMFRILLNLARNATQAMESTKGDNHVLRISAARQNNSTIRIIVEDTGPGIPEDMQDTLFEAFKSQSRPGGTGLGLTIVADLVRVHDGKIRLMKTDKGAAFEIIMEAARDMDIVQHSEPANEEKEQNQRSMLH